MNKHAIKKRTFNIMVILLAIALTASLVTAGLLSNFGKVETTMTVQQSVQIDGNNYDDIITHTIEDAVGGCCYCFDHEVTNNGCEAIWLDWVHWGTPNIIGIDVDIKERCYLSQLDIRALDGIANDSFDAYVDGILVYSYIDQAPVNDPEMWTLHNIDLTPFNILCLGTHTITIDATGPAWSHFQTYGQVAIDTIDLYCGECIVWCDGVDIGDPTSEAGHNLVSWGPIEPATSGGNWGGINDCRVIWDTIDGGSTFATVDLTCEFCECTCEKPSMEMPFELNPGQTIDFCICYKLDMLIAPGQYVISSKLVPAIV